MPKSEKQDVDFTDGEAGPKGPSLPTGWVEITPMRYVPYAKIAGVGIRERPTDRNNWRVTVELIGGEQVLMKDYNEKKEAVEKAFNLMHTIERARKGR